MKPGETLIQMAERHILEGERHVRSQRAILARLDADGLPTDVAEDLLQQFESSLADHRASLARMRDEQRRGLRDAGGQLIFDA